MVGQEQSESERLELITALERELLEAAELLQFERAATLRDKIDAIQRSGKDGKTSQKNKRRRKGE